MNMIAISRKFSSGGCEVRKQPAAILDYAYPDRELKSNTLNPPGRYGLKSRTISLKYKTQAVSFKKVVSHIAEYTRCWFVSNRI